MNVAQAAVVQAVAWAARSNASMIDFALKKKKKEKKSPNMTKDGGEM